MKLQVRWQAFLAKGIGIAGSQLDLTETLST
jgi:hypothetical protein